MIRRFSILALVALALAPLGAASNPFWHLDQINTNPAGSCNWFAVSAASEARVWAVGRKGDRAFMTSGPTFFDYDWVDKILPISYRDRLHDVFVLPADTAYVWVVAEDTVHHTGVIAYTHDGGANWYTSDPLGGFPDSLSPFYAVCFANKDRGYIAAGNGIILKTDDGGEHWTRRDGPWSEAECFWDIWTNPGSGDSLLVVSDNNSQIATSTDGGANWSLYTGNALNTTYSIPGLGAQHPGKFVTSDISLSTGRQGAIALSHGRIAKTTDFGGNWNVSALESSPTWFEACDYGTSDTLYLVSKRVLIRSEPGEIEYIAGTETGQEDSFDLHDIDMVPDSGRGFAVGDCGHNLNHGRKFRRYDPVRFVFDSLYVAYPTNCNFPCTLVVAWHTKFERNTEEWRCALDYQPIIRNPGPNYTPEHTNVPAAGFSNDSTGYVYRRRLPENKNVTYYFSLYLETNDNTVHPYLYCGGPYEVVVGNNCPGWEEPCVPDPPRNVVAQDKSGDQGRTLELSWEPPEDTSCLRNYMIGRSLNEDGPFFKLLAYQSSTAFNDDHVMPGNEYHYIVCSVGSLATNDVVYQGSDTVPVSGTSIDNESPSQVDSIWHDLQERVEGDSIRIRFNWLEDKEDSTICGYWFCPEENEIIARTVVHKAPIRRTWYMLKGPWETGQSIIAGVLAMDCSGNMGTQWKDDTMFVANYQTAHWDATAHNNANRIGQSLDENLHFGFSSKENDTDFVYYQKSTDEGSHWTTPTKVGRGRDPCLRLTTAGTPYMIWRMTQPSGGNLVGKLYFSKYSGGEWITPVEIYSTTAPEFAVGSPAAVTSKNLSHIVWEARKNTGGIGYSDIVFAGYLDLNAGSPSLTYQGIDTVWSGGPTLDSTESSPSVDIDLEGQPHVIWQKGNDVYYVAKGPSGWPSNHENISGTSSNESRNAHIDLQGDWVRAVWEEQHTLAAQYYDVLLWSYWNGAGIECSQSSSISSNCLEPVIDGNFILWSEKVGSRYEVFVSAYDHETYSWGDSANISSYPYGDSRYPQVITEAIRCYLDPEIYCAWTEGSAGYWTRFQKETFTKKQPYYPHDLGLEAESPVTIERDGYITYGSSTYETVDYDTDTLKYECNLDSAYEHTLELTYYDEGGSGREYELIIDGTPVDTSSVPSEEKTTVTKEVPEAAVQDGQITIEIASTGGDTVTCGDFLLFQSSPEGGMGGGQAVTHRRAGLPLRPTLKALNPNPSRGRPTIEYFLPDERYAKVQVFDVSGRLVETLASGRQKPGWHKAVWNSENNGAGVYFCRMNAGDVSVTQKLVLVR
jgi:hypothetical protein